MAALNPAELIPRAAPLDAPEPQVRDAERAGAPSFADALGKALGDVDRMQVAADRQAESVALGKGNLHEAALALEKADVALKVAMKVRNKLVDAYQEIMRMSV